MTRAEREAWKNKVATILKEQEARDDRRALLIGLPLLLFIGIVGLAILKWAWMILWS